MKHLQKISQTPAKAQEPTPGQILTFVATILSALAQAFLQKETPTTST